jgi:hypothetical protein
VTVTVTGPGTVPQSDSDDEEWLDTLDVLWTDDDVVATGVLSEDVDMVVTGTLSEDVDAVVMGILSEEVEVVVVGVYFEDVEVIVVGVLSEDVELVLADELLTMLVLVTTVELIVVAGQSGTSEEQLVIVTHCVLVKVLVEGALSGGSPYCPFAALVRRATDRVDRAHDDFARSMTVQIPPTTPSRAAEAVMCV